MAPTHESAKHASRPEKSRNLLDAHEHGAHECPTAPPAKALADVPASLIQ